MLTLLSPLLPRCRDFFHGIIHNLTAAQSQKTPADSCKHTLQKHHLFTGMLLLAGLLASPVPQAATPDTAVPPAMPTLKAFANEQELSTLLKTYGDKVRRHQEEMNKRYRSNGPGLPPPTPTAMPAPAMTMTKSAAPAAAAASSESVTNTQTAGVDEGGIVKVHGKHLVILRRGRLFTVEIGIEAKGKTLKPVAMLDAYGPDISPGGAWYDEMLVSGNSIVVIGYSYARGGTEVGLFSIDDAGQLAYQATYHLRSNDYYSSRNYASRLIGDKLVFYTPLFLSFYGNPLEGFPAVRRWQKAEKDKPQGEFKRIAPATRIYRTDDDLDPVTGNLALHTVTVCDLSKAAQQGGEMACQATAILGPRGRVFYVSADSVYVWTTQQVMVNKAGDKAEQQTSENRAALFRLPLDGSAPTAIKAQGVPVDQFSFLEANNTLNVLLRAEGRGEGMWGSEVNQGDLALLRLPLTALGDGTTTAATTLYQPLSKPSGYALQNRYIGNYLLYGAGRGWGYGNEERQAQTLHLVRWDKAQPEQLLGVPHTVDRIEALGNHALIVGTAGKELHFSSLQLDPEKGGSFVSRYVQPDAQQGETRSHGFFYLPQSETTGLLGLPIRKSGGSAGLQQLVRESAAILYLQNRNLKLGELGQLVSNPEVGQDDNCHASCVDWYGNSRPLFLRQRVFALMGYELVEGQIKGQKISEVRRISYAPPPQKPESR